MVAHVQGIEPPQLAKSFFPHPRFEIGLEAKDSARDHVLVKKRKPRDPSSHRWIQVRLRSAPISREESVSTVVRYGDAGHSAVPDVAHEIGDRRTSARNCTPRW